jgi:SET domain-containing protein
MSKGKLNLAVKRTTTGLGLFTLASLPKGQRIIEYSGPIVSAEESLQRGGKYYFELDEEQMIDGSSRDNKARYLNHSCLPNTKAYVSGKRIWIWSLRDLKAGEEITIDYGRDYLESHIQRCKCESCISGLKREEEHNI